jgi:toxin-antitoxin system PIN domain toxin
MRALFDVNALLAIFDDRHIFHERIRGWWSEHVDDGWASSPLTQNGFVRVLSQPSYTNSHSLAEALAVMRAGVVQPEHAFWPDDIQITDPDVFDHSRILGPGQITDVYLLGLAVKNGGRLVTFDKGVPIAAVRGAGRDHLVSL